MTHGRALLELVGVVVSGYLVYSARKNKSMTSQYQQLFELQEKTIARLEKQFENQCLSKEDLLEQFKSLEQDMKLLEKIVNEDYNSQAACQDFIEYIPTPMWMKYPKTEREGFSKMCFINQAYEVQWGISKSSYHDRADDQVWPLETAIMFADHDFQVTNYKVSLITTESVPKYPFRDVSKDNPLEEWLIWKFPVLYNKNVIGVGGAGIKQDIKANR